MAKTKLSMDVPTNPTFSISKIGDSVSKPIQFEFTLLNMNQDALEKNFRFLHAFFAGTQWLQFPGGTIKSTNVYNVYCPGRFHIFWASLDMSVTADGKLRKCTEMKKKLDKIKSIDENTLWPEVWKVSITINSLTPDNFNTYIHHFVHGFEEGTVKLLGGNNRAQSIEKIVDATDPLNEMRANGSLMLGAYAEDRADFMAHIKGFSEQDAKKSKEAALEELERKLKESPNSKTELELLSDYELLTGKPHKLAKQRKQENAKKISKNKETVDKAIQMVKYTTPPGALPPGTIPD